MKKTFILSIIIAAVVSSLTTLGAIRILPTAEKTTDELIKEFYLVENAVHVSPHSVRGKMDQGNQSFILVDLRSPQEYEKEHIIGAVSIPAYSDPNTSAYQEVDRIVSAFKALIKNNPDKEIIVYCYSMPCMTGRKIGKMLMEHDIYVKHLGVGWNEWRYFWNLWNHDGETPTKWQDYVISGKDPGKPVVRGIPAPCVQGEFGC